jgi:signal transduction histidine kinase
VTADPGRVTRAPGGWRRLVRRADPGTVRARVTVVAGLALTAAVVLGLVVMYRLQLNSAKSTIQGQLRAYATQIEQSAASWHRTRALPGSGLDPAAQAQVVAPDGTVLAATRNWLGRPALYTLALRSTTPVRTPAADRLLPDDLSVFPEYATAGGDPVIIVTATRSYLQSQVDQTFARLLVIGVPVLLVLACGTVWLVVGRALRPVEQLRSAVTAITSADLSQRVPEPGTDDEIGRLAHTMNDMLARLDDSAARQRRFVADASHELRSPLTAIRAGLEVGLSHPDRAPWPQIAGRAVRQSQRLEQLIAQLLVLAKADAYQLTARRQPVDLAALLADLHAATPAPGISIDLSVPTGTTTAGNPEDLSRMFRNLLDNAVRYARHRVLVTAAAGPDGVVVQIADDGPGIPEEERERVFGRFVRLDASREQASGSAGLGLAIAREIAAAHGATIVLTEAPGGGTLAAVAMGGTKGAGGEITAGPAHRSGQNELIGVPAPRQPTGSALTPMLTSYQAARCVGLTQLYVASSMWVASSLFQVVFRNRISRPVSGSFSA